MNDAETHETEQALQAKLEALVRAEWGKRDPDVTVSSTLHDDGKIDLTVISHLFEGQDGLEREAAFWPVFDSVPRSELVRMTYCLLLTPGEAARQFAVPGPPLGVSNTDNWE